MGHPNSEGPKCVFEYPWPGCRTGKYQHVTLRRSSYPNIYFLLGIPTSEHNLCGDWHSSLGQCSYGFPGRSILTLGAPRRLKMSARIRTILPMFSTASNVSFSGLIYTLGSHRLLV